MSSRTQESKLQDHLQGGPWCLIESDPTVFSSLVRGLGVKGGEVIDVYWDLDDKESWEREGEVYGLIFLFKVSMEIDKSGEEFDDDEELLQVYFANQVIDNACATQAVLNIVLNCDRLDIGPELENFKDFTREFKPPLKGLAMTNTASFRNNHNRFVRFAEDLQIIEQQKAKELENDDYEDEEPVYHYIGYVPFKGNVYELDGLARNPRKLGAIEGNDWIEVARSSVSERMHKFNDSGIAYSLMAIIKDREMLHEEKAKDKEIEKKAIEKRLQELDKNWSKNNEINKGTNEDNENDAGQSYGSETNRKIEVVQKIQDIELISEVGELLERHKNLIQEIRLELEQAEKERENKINAEADNVRRKHDYVPFLTEFIKILDERGELEDILDDLASQPMEAEEYEYD
ncbi:hypothetical protein G9A89_003134 [Geosiphon pyriformis]|nr:hypothetical protein G9A89_003134 [Geosiphon pyriformis]